MHLRRPVLLKLQMRHKLIVSQGHFFWGQSVNMDASIPFYSVLGLVCFVALGNTLLAHPLWDWKIDNLDWVRAWLGMTVLDYYGAALALSGVVFSERSFLEGLAWSLGFCVLGSPVCCAYMVYRTVNK